MRTVENTLRALKTLVDFDLAEAARDLSQAAVEVRAQKEREMDSSIRCTATVRDFRRAMRQGPANLELVGTLHRLYRHQRTVLDETKARLQAAQEREAALRDAVNERLMKEKLLDRMLRRQAQVGRAIFESQQHKQLEDAWLRANRRRGT